MSYKNLDGAVAMIVQNKKMKQIFISKRQVHTALQSYETIYTNKQ